MKTKILQFFPFLGLIQLYYLYINIYDQLIDLQNRKGGIEKLINHISAFVVST